MEVKYRVFKVGNHNDIEKYCGLLIEAGYSYMISADDPDDRMERDISEHIFMCEYESVNEPSWIIACQNRYRDFLIWNNYEYETRFDSKKGMVVVDSVYNIDNIKK